MKKIKETSSIKIFRIIQPSQLLLSPVSLKNLHSTSVFQVPFDNSQITSHYVNEVLDKSSLQSIENNSYAKQEHRQITLNNKNLKNQINDCFEAADDIHSEQLSQKKHRITSNIQNIHSRKNFPINTIESISNLEPQFEQNQISSYHRSLENKKKLSFQALEDVQSFKSAIENRQTKSNFKNQKSNLRIEDYAFNQQQSLEHRQAQPNYQSIENKKINSIRNLEDISIAQLPNEHKIKSINRTYEIKKEIKKKIPSKNENNDLNEESFVNWCFKKEYFNISNLGWIFFGLLISFLIVSSSILITISRFHQIDSDSKRFKLQTSRLVGDECKTSFDCLENGFCDFNNRCQCVPDFYYDLSNGICIRFKTYGSNCTDSWECDKYLNLNCINNQCRCPGSTIWANYYGNFECVRQRIVGEISHSSDHCITSSSTIKTDTDTICQCPPDYYLNVNFECLPRLKINEKCDGYYNECPLLTSCRSINSDSIPHCYCITDYYYDSVSQSCIKAKEFNESCENESKCQNFGLICLSNKCKCPSSQYWNGKLCVDFAVYGKQCSSQIECNPFDSSLICGVPPASSLESIRKICYCMSGFYFDEFLSKCIKYKLVNMPCSDSSECALNAICVDNQYRTIRVCQCMIGHYFDIVKSICVRMLNYGETCQENNCDNLVGLICVAGKCLCQSDFFWNGKKCELSNTYGETCAIFNAYDSCRTSKNLICNIKIKKCTCKNGFTIIKNQCI